MSRFLVGNLFLLLSILGATAGHILLKAVVDEVSSSTLGWSTLQALLAPGRFWRGAGGASLVVVAFLCWLAALTRLDLSYAYPVACSSLLLVTLFSVTLLDGPRRAAVVQSYSGYCIAVLINRADPLFPAEVHEVLDPVLQQLQPRLEGSPSVPPGQPGQPGQQDGLPVPSDVAQPPGTDYWSNRPPPFNNGTVR